MCLSSAGAYAAGLGRMMVLSPLGQPLRAELDITASREELPSLTARLASAEAFKQVGIEYVPAISGIRFALDKRPDGQPFLRVTTDRPVNEPFLDILIELTWSSGRMVREYTMLLDPPDVFAKPATAPVAAPEVKLPEPAPAATSIQEVAPVAAPIRSQPTKAAVPVRTPAEKQGGEEGTRAVKNGDTLSKIAVATRPEGASLDQMLVALFRGNQDAFDGGNMNRLRAGKILTIPNAETVAAVIPGEARQMVVTQASDFNAYRRKLAALVAGTPPVKEEAAKQQAEGKIAPNVEEKIAAPTPGKDKLEVSRTETAKDTRVVQGRISALEEDLVSRDRALKDASSRVADLEKNLTELKKLAELKSQAGVQMQQQAQQAKPAPEVVPPVTKPAEIASAQPVEEAKPADKPNEAVPAEQAAKPAAAATPDKPAAVAVPMTKPAEAPQAPEEPSFVEENKTLVLGGGGVLALLLGYLGYSSWRRKRQAGEESPSTASQLSTGELMANSVFGSTGGQAVDTGASIQTDFSQANLTAIDADEGVDPVAEADVYMAYGRDAQAEEILLDALKNDPSRHAIHLKLLEIYSGRKDVKQFGSVATNLYGQTGGAGTDWDKAAAMGRILDPDNSLYAGTAPAGERAAEMLGIGATTIVVPPSEADKLHDTVSMPGQFRQMAAAAEEPAAAQPTVLDFDLDLGAPTETAVAPATLAAATVLDFNLDLDSSMVPPAPPAETSHLDIDLSLPELKGAPSEPAAATAGSDGLDFEFDLDVPAAAPEIGIPPAAVPSAPALNLSNIDFDLGSPAAAVEPTLAHADEDSPDVATKLELAQAYEEMGDKEGARELLQEVLQEGSSRQQELARGKLAILDA
ncbi:MAG TPA: FimV/HubP family polar landmark protein [Rhodocyclaceae bacterium]|nr:FimV/HubP family polar landmark protein [Rhodocyclaceae bacterium]